MIFTTEKQLKDYGEKISADKKENLEKALADLKEAHKAKDLPRIETTLAALNTAWQAASEEMYKAASEAQPQQPGAEQNGAPHADGHNGEAKKDGEVTDVDFEEVKEEKK